MAEGLQEGGAGSLRRPRSGGETPPFAFCMRRLLEICNRVGQHSLPAGIFLLIALPADAAPANTLQELFASLEQCVRAPGGVPGSELTIVFSVKRDGSLLGKPRISYSKLLGNAEAQRTFVAGAIRSVEACLPVSITPSLGNALAGHPMSLRIVSQGRGTET